MWDQALNQCWLLFCVAAPLPLAPLQAAVAQKEAAEAALEQDAQSVRGGKDNLADAAKDVAGEAQGLKGAGGVQEGAL